MTKERSLNASAWSLSTIAVVIAITAWGQSLRWNFNHLSTYQFFPVLGLIAYGVMWSHYIAAVCRQYLKIDKSVLHKYFELTSLVVLAAIVLHPGLLWYQLWRDGFGLPPGSYLEHYVAPSLRWAAILGTLCLGVFLLYELRRKFESKSWWKYIAYLTDAAMIGILIHSLNLGTNLQRGWLRFVWYFYGVTLIASLAYIYNNKLNKKSS